MPPKWDKRPPSGRKAPRGRPTPSRGRIRQSIPSTPTMAAASHGFSMKDEARNTASHQYSLDWGSGDAKLRQKPVTFVSAGVVEPLKEQKPSSHVSESETADKRAEDAVEVTGDSARMEAAEIQEMEIIDDREGETIIEGPRQETPMIKGASTEQFVVGANESEDAQESEKKELFFFDLGEGESVLDTGLPPPRIPSPKSSLDGSDSSEEVILFKGRFAGAPGASDRTEECRPKECRPSASATASVTPLKREAEALAGPSNSESRSITRPTRPLRKRSRSRRGFRQTRRAMEDSDEDAILADYIANMTTNSDDDPLASHLRSLSGYRDLGGDDEAVNFGFDDGKSPGRNDSSDDERSSAPGYDIGNSEMDDSEMDDSVNGDDDQEMDAAVDDETLARLLAKQEELGLGGDDLLLFTSSFAQRETTKSRGKHTASASSSRAPARHASAARVADALDDLDLANWSQLTGQSRKRRSKRPPNFNVSDSKIEAALQAAWQRDRERKKIRKLEREALRAGGLLGKNMDSNDLRVKYPSGMKLDDIKAELTSFLLGSVERLDFPPLDKHARMVLHEIANKLNIKSKSTGQGNQRRPVLYRTNRTFKYASTRIEDAASHVDKAATRVHRKYFHRVDVKVQRTESPRSAGGRTSHKALTLREGEVVGASVPELGQDNKGRAMLEKMGWSKGMALGALDNKGILEPVAQVMKRSKAGLG